MKLLKILKSYKSKFRFQHEVLSKWLILNQLPTTIPAHTKFKCSPLLSRSLFISSIGYDKMVYHGSMLFDYNLDLKILVNF